MRIEGPLIYDVSHASLHRVKWSNGFNSVSSTIFYGRRKFRSQTSDNMDRWKAEVVRVKEEKRRAIERRSEKRKSQKKEDAGARKGRKVAKHCVFPMIGGSGGSKSRLARAAGAEPAGQVRDEKMHAIVARSTFPSQNVQSTPCWDQSWDVEKVHAVVAGSTFRSQNAQNTPCSDHFLKLRCLKSACRCGAKHISKSKCTKHFSFGALLELAVSKKWMPLWREAHFEVKMLKTPHVRATSLSKVIKTWRFCSISNSDGRRGTFEEDLQRCIFRGRCSTRDMFIRAVRRSGADFLRGVAFWSLWSSGLLRWFCVTGAALRMTWHHFFVAGAVVWTDGLEKSQNTLVRGRQLCTQISIFEGCLAELLHFWCCQLKKMRKSRRIASFLLLSSAKIEEVSLNCCVFDAVKFKNWGSLAE